MSFPDAVKSVFSNYANFSGRARRSEFWFWYLFLMLVNAVAGIVVAVVASSSVDVEAQTVGGAFYAALALLSLVDLALVLPMLAVSVRRLHDQDKSGFFWFMGLIPLAGPILMIVFYATPGTVGANRFGPDPKLAQVPAQPVAA